MAITSKGHNSIEIKCHKYSVSTACQHFCDKVNVDIKSKYISKRRKNVSYQKHPNHQNNWFYEYFHSNYLGVALRCNWSYKYKIRGHNTLWLLILNNAWFCLEYITLSHSIHAQWPFTSPMSGSGVTTWLFKGRNPIYSLNLK